jgi:hypothetical protein
VSVETDLLALLQVQCPRAFADFAPQGTACPLVTFSHLGGRVMDYLDNTVSDKRHTFFTINAWANTRRESIELIRAIEAALRAASVFTARPDDEPFTNVETDIQPPRYGASQVFEIWSSR